MPDGSSLELGARTALEVEFSGTRRAMTLSSGRAYFKVAPDKKRPFVVRAGVLDIAAVGTSFDIRRTDLQITVSELDAHPGVHGAYINACSLYTILTGESPVGLPATLKIPGRNEDLAMAPDDAKYLQELAWKIYRREIKNTKPAK